jgi:hypothetical protein
VKFTASDVLSGIDSVTTDKVISIEGAKQIYTGEAVDAAGNKNTASITLNIDKTAPQTSIEVVGQEGQNNWYVDDVMVTLTATDSLSGISFIEYSFNQGLTWEQYKNPIKLSEDHVLYYT